MKKTSFSRAQQITRMIRHLRNTHPEMTDTFTRGGCFQLYLMLKAIEPSAEAWYSDWEGHVYTRLGSRFFDINGCATPPDDVKPMSTALMKKARQWARRNLWKS